jgi:hypothetical protein
LLCSDMLCLPCCAVLHTVCSVIPTGPVSIDLLHVPGHGPCCVGAANLAAQAPAAPAWPCPPTILLLLPSQLCWRYSTSAATGLWDVGTALAGVGSYAAVVVWRCVALLDKQGSSERHFGEAELGACHCRHSVHCRHCRLHQQKKQL